MNNKINVLFLTIQLETIGGSEKLIYNLASKIDRTIFNPYIAWFFAENVLKEFKDLDVPLFYIPKTKRFDFSSMQRVGQVIRENNIDIVNAHHFMPMVYAFYGCKIFNHTKVVFTEHSEWEIKRVSWLWKKIGHFILKRSNGNVGVTDRVSQLIQKQFNLHPSETIAIQNGVNLHTFSHDIKKELSLKNELGLRHNTKIIGIVANFRQIKNHLFLLKAFFELIKEFNDVKLLLIGEGYEDDSENSESEIRDYVRRKALNKNVIFLGYRTDIPTLLGIMDIFCLTSFKEGMPISLIEAMAAGLAVVGTDVEGIQDMIINGKNGFLVKVDDIEGLKRILSRLLQDKTLRETCGHESRALATSRYSLQRCVHEYQKLFASVLGERTDSVVL